jgi:hypothetical protein
MIEPNQKLLSDDRILRVKLAGVDWPIPKLSIMINEIVLPLFIKHKALLPGLAKGEMELAMSSRETIRDFSTVVYWGLTRGHEELTRDEFDKMPLEINEVFLAAILVWGQTGMIVTQEKAGVNGVSRPLAVEATSSPTG